MLTIAKVLDKRHLYRSDNGHLRNFLQVSRFYQKLRTETQLDNFCKTRVFCQLSQQTCGLYPQKNGRTPCANRTKVASAEAEAVANLANAAAKTREIPRPPEVRAGNPPKINISNLKTGGWKMILSFWKMAYFQVPC